MPKDETKACEGCQRKKLDDEKGACFGNGWLCPKCGYYSKKEPSPNRTTILDINLD